jgi:magnesium transporter
MKPAPIDYDTVREMLRTATPDRVLRFIGKSHPADIALLFKGLEPAEVRQLFDVLFSSRRAAKTLKELPPELLPDILALIDDEKIGHLIVRRPERRGNLYRPPDARRGGHGPLG